MGQALRPFDTRPDRLQLQNGSHALTSFDRRIAQQAAQLLLIRASRQLNVELHLFGKRQQQRPEELLIDFTERFI